MASVSASDLRKKTADELADLLLEYAQEKFNLRVQKSTGQLENTARLRQVRRIIALIKTIMNEQANGAAQNA